MAYAKDLFATPSYFKIVSFFSIANLFLMNFKFEYTSLKFPLPQISKFL